MKTTQIKLLLLFILVVVLGGGIFLYATRPIAVPPSSDQGQSASAPQEENRDEITPPPAPVLVPEPQPAQAVVPPPAPVTVTQYTIASGSSEASFTISEVLRGSPFTVVGTTKDVTGDISIDTAHPEKSMIGTIKIDARTLHTDNSQRDGAVGRFILKSEQEANAFITFTPKTISGFPKEITAAKMKLTIVGDLTISGITHSTTFISDNVIVTKDAVTGTAQATIKRSDYNLNIPNIPFVANVPDEFTLKIIVNAAVRVQ